MWRIKFDHSEEFNSRVKSMIALQLCTLSCNFMYPPGALNYATKQQKSDLKVAVRSLIGLPSWNGVCQDSAHRAFELGHHGSPLLAMI